MKKVVGNNKLYWILIESALNISQIKQEVKLLNVHQKMFFNATKKIRWSETLVSYQFQFPNNAIVYPFSFFTSFSVTSCSLSNFCQSQYFETLKSHPPTFNVSTNKKVSMTKLFLCTIPIFRRKPFIITCSLRKIYCIYTANNYSNYYHPLTQISR